MNHARSAAYRLGAWALVLLYLGAIFYLSSRPSVPVPPLFRQQDKLFHFTAYFGLGFVSAHAIYPGSLRARFWLALLLASLYGASDEFHQSFVPGRDVEFFDWVADTAGGYFGALTFLRGVRYRWRSRGPKPTP